MICQICNEEHSDLSKHLRFTHKVKLKDYYDRFLKKAGEDICVVCGNETKFANLEKGYKTTCSNKCSATNPIRRAKAKNTLIENYGVDSPFKNKDILEKAKNTMIKKYGVDNIAKSEEYKKKSRESYFEKTGYYHNFQNPEVQRKIKETNLNKLGVEYPAQSKTVQEKREKTCIEKYGETVASKSNEVKEKAKSTNREKYGTDWFTQTDNFKEKTIRTNNKKYGVNWFILTEECRKKNLEILRSIEHKRKVNSTIQSNYGVNYPLESSEVRMKAVENRKRDIEKFKSSGYSLTKDVVETFGYKWKHYLNIPITERKGCKFINNEDLPKIEKWCKENRFRSEFERSVVNFIEELGVNYETNNRKQIFPYEIDIYIPEKKVAIECDGVWYHSTNNETPRDYHLMKTKMCEEKGIRLIHISDWEWCFKNDICKSIITSSLGIYKERIYARKCRVKKVDISSTIKFLNENHIQGIGVYPKYILGLYYNEELIQLITLGPSRFKKGETELLRMCSKLNTQVVGGFSKLISNLPKEIKEIYSYIDRGKFDGKGYYSTGWNFVSETSPNYHYYKGSNRFSRNSCQKHKLKEFLGEENFKEDLTELENMLLNDFIQMFDSGNIKVKKTI